MYFIKGSLLLSFINILVYRQTIREPFGLIANA